MPPTFRSSSSAFFYLYEVATKASRIAVVDRVPLNTTHSAPTSPPPSPSIAIVHQRSSSSTVERLNSPASTKVVESFSVFDPAAGDSASNLAEDASLVTEEQRHHHSTPFGLLDSLKDDSPASPKTMSRRATEWRCLISALTAVLCLIGVIAVGLFIVKVYFLPELQKHHRNGRGKVTGAGSSSGEGRSTQTDPDDVLFGIIIGLAALLSSLPIPTLYTVTCVGGGFAMGFWNSLIPLLPCSAIGVAVMFAASRRWLHDLTNSYIRRTYPNLHRTVEVVQRPGPIMIMRLTPIPFAMQTMLWGSCSTVGFSTFFPATMAVVVPQVAMFAYIGASTSNLTQTLNSRSPAEVVIVVVGILILIIGSFKVSQWAKDQVAKAERERERQTTGGESSV